MIAFEDLCNQSINNLANLTASHKNIWNFGKETEWKLDQNDGRIVFIFDNELTASADAQIIGTFNSKNNSWKWAWDNSTISLQMMLDSKLVKQYGMDHGFDELIASDINCSEEFAWTLAAVACKLCNAQGVYRGPAGATYVFISFREVTINKNKS